LSEHKRVQKAKHETQEGGFLGSDGLDQKNKPRIDKGPSLGVFGMSGIRDFTNELLAKTTTAREGDKVFVTTGKTIPNVNSEQL
jgi:hypothetical protein